MKPDIYKPYFALCLIVLCTKTCESAKILAIFAMPAGSHMNIIRALVQPLLKRGHEIDLVSHFPLKINNERYTDIDISKSFPSLNNNITVDKSSIGDIATIGRLIDDFGLPIMDSVLNFDRMSQLRNSSKKYDLVIRHIFLTEPMEAFAHLFKAPSIGIITSVNLPWSSSIVGLPDNPSYIPNYYSPYGENMNFFERTFNTILYVYLKLKYFGVEKHSDRLIAKYFGEEYPGTEELLKKTSLVLCNSHYSIHQSRPVPPNFVEIGGIHIQERRNDSLPKHLKEALDSATQGLIYVSFGSLIRSETFDVQKLEAMLQTLGELPYKIFWKGDKENFPKTVTIPDNFHVMSWMPQLDILCHSNTKLFIGHGGLFGTQEAVYCGVPIVGIPFAVDQGSNLRLMEEKGVGKSLTYEKITKAAFSEAVKTLLQEKYKTNAEKLSKVFTDRPMSPMNTAIYWIEYVIKHKGAPFMKSGATKLEWYQYFLVDVIGLFLAVFLILLLVVYFIILRLYRVVMNTNKLNYIYKKLQNKIKYE